MAWLGDAARVRPSQPTPLHELANLLLNQQQYAQAWPVYQQLYTRFGARDRATLLHSAFAWSRPVRWTTPCACTTRPSSANPTLKTHVDLAGVLWRVEKRPGALAHAQRAEALAPGHPYAVRIVGTSLLHLNRLGEAEQQLRRALQLQPGFNLAQVDLALTLLLAGKLRRRLGAVPPALERCRPHARPAFFPPALEWQGPARQPVHGRRVLVYAEQGLGDVLHFIRYVPQLQADGATVFAVVQPELAPLLGSMPGLGVLPPWHRTRG